LSAEIQGWKLCSLFTQKLVYKIVVIVNRDFFVDKPGFFHNINGLPFIELAGEPLLSQCREGE